MKWGFETTIEGEAVFSVLFSIGMRQIRERNEVQSFRELVHERKWFVYGVSNTGRMEDNIFNIIMINAGVRNTVLGLWTVERAEKIRNIHIWLRRVIKVSWKSLSFFFLPSCSDAILKPDFAHARCTCPLLPRTDKRLSLVTAASAWSNHVGLLSRQRLIGYHDLIVDLSSVSRIWIYVSLLFFTAN